MNARGRSDVNTDEPPARQRASLAQLREILFGAVQRDLERRLARADAQLASRAEELQAEVKRRTEVLESHLAKELDALRVQLETQQRTQAEASDRIANAAHEAVAVLERRVARLEEALAAAQREMRQEALAQAKSFFDELHGLRAELSALLDHELTLFRSDVEGDRAHETEPSPPQQPTTERTEH